MIELHNFLKKVNEAVIKYNKSRPISLQLPPVTIDELISLNHFGDIEKGLMGCSVGYLVKQKTFIRNFDWPSLGDIFNHFTRSIHLTNHTDENKPRYVIGWSLPFNPGFTGTNGHLVLALNEAEKR